MSTTRTFIIPALATYGEYDAESGTSKREITLHSGETFTLHNLNTYAERHADTEELFVTVEVERGSQLDDTLLERFYNGGVELKHSFIVRERGDCMEHALTNVLGNTIMDRSLQLEWDVAYLVERAERAASTAPESSDPLAFLKNTMIAVSALLDFHLELRERDGDLHVTLVETVKARHYRPWIDETIEIVPVTLTGELKADINTIPASEWDAAWSERSEPWSGEGGEPQEF